MEDSDFWTLIFVEAGLEGEFAQRDTIVWYAATQRARRSCRPGRNCYECKDGTEQSLVPLK